MPDETIWGPHAEPPDVPEDPQPVEKGGEKAVAEELREIGATLVPEGGVATPEGEGGVAPAPLSDEEPPDDAFPTFLIMRNKFGPGAHSVKFADGTPVGVWLDRERHDADPGAVAGELSALGLDDDLAVEFAERRAMRMEATGELQRLINEAPEDSALKVFLRYEGSRVERMEPLRVAFIKAQGKKVNQTKEE